LLDMPNRCKVYMILISLNDLKPGEKAIVKQIASDSEDINYLQELGLLEGTEIKIIKRAPFGDPFEIDLRGYRLSLRREKAQSIMVEKVV